MSERSRGCRMNRAQSFRDFDLDSLPTNTFAFICQSLCVSGSLRWFSGETHELRVTLSVSHTLLSTPRLNLLHNGRRTM